LERLGHSHHINGLYCLVGTQANEHFYASFESGGDKVVHTEDIGLHRFHRKGLAGWYLLQRCSLEDHLNALHCLGYRLPVSKVTNYECKVCVTTIEALHIVLLFFVSTQDTDFPGSQLE